MENLHYRKFEFKIPVFFGCLGSLALCALLVTRLPEPAQSLNTEDRNIVVKTTEEISAAAGSTHFEKTHFFTQIRPKSHDYILELYRQPETRSSVIDFFMGICPSAEITEAILFYSDSFDIAPALAFALGWEESRLDPFAVNVKNRDESIDRGLFQLNSSSFPQLEIQAFFNLELNTYYGMGHLRFCLDTGGTEIAALAMYNAGSGRVRNVGTPKTTLDYVSRILENRREIENRFFDWERNFKAQPDDDVFETVVEAKPDHSFLVLLMPLGVW